MERTETDWMSSKTMIMPMAVDPDDASYLTRVEVYQGSNCLVDDEFCKNYISIGRSSKSDIVLPDTRISRNRFYLYIDNYQIFVFVLPNKQPLRINGQPVNAAQLGTDDTIEIGPYTLKIQVRFNDDPPQSAEDLRYQVVFEGQIQNGFTRSQVAKNLKKQLKINGQQTASLFSGKSVVIGQDLDLPKAVQFKNKLEKSGAIGQVQAVINSAGADEKSLNGMSVANLPGENDDLIPKNGKSAAPLSNRTVKNSKARNSVANLPGPSDEKRASAKPEIHGSNPPDEKPKIKHPGTNQPDRTVLKPQDPMADAEIAEQPGEKTQNDKSTSRLDLQGLRLPDSSWPFLKPAADDEDEDDEDDILAPFSLKEKLSTFGAFDRRQQNRAPSSARSLGVFKFRNDAVIDVCYLNSNESYYTDANRGRFRLAQKNGTEKGYLYINQNFIGTLRSKESGTSSLSDFLTPDYLYRRRKQIYRVPIPDPGEVYVNDGCFDYLIRPIFPDRSPAVAEPRKIKELSWKHGATSLLVHILLLVILALLPSSALRNDPEPETRFVKVDPHILEQIQPKPKSVVKPPAPKPRKSEPAPKPAKKKPVVKKKAVVKKKPLKAAKKPLKTASRKAVSKSGKKNRKSKVSRDPKAGGGYGKGNTANRNVKQVGVLGMLGDSKASQVQPAIADVTNLDAVRSNNSGQAKFKVGGIKGKLGTSDVSVAGGRVVATKGNSQVLRSYGAGGGGRVAALKKGSVGQKQVKGMVQASLNKAVRIRGGMSREAVKRVIEQHLDEITYCYETALISNPSIKGKITMEWKIRMSGAVGEVRIKSSTVKSPEIYACIKSAIKTWRFPKPVGNEVVVSYPFIFDIVGF